MASDFMAASLARLRLKASVKPTSKDEILDAAERVFAAKGFDGASMREIAEAAEVAQSLLHYHFGAKEGLFEAMFLRRSEAINGERLRRLDGVAGKTGPMALDAILDALLRPTIEAGHDAARGGHSFARLILMTGATDDQRARDLISRSYDGVAARYIAAIRGAIPGLSEADAVWGYLLVIGAALSMMAPTGRADRLSGGAASDADHETLLARAIAFSAAGLRALATGARSP